MDLISSRIYLSRHVVFDESQFPFLNSSPVTMPSLSPSIAAQVTDQMIPAVPPIALPPSTTNTVMNDPSTAPPFHSPSPTQGQSPEIHPPIRPQTPQHRIHQMRTRSMNNIHKPK